jgi:hypothetical protein
MRNDIYNRNPADPNFIDGQLEMDDTLEMFKQQIESCLFTPKTAVMGDIDFGASLEEYVWSFRTSVSALKAILTRQIQSYCTMSKGYPFSVDVQFYRGTIRDIAQIDIIIDAENKFSVIVA